MGFNYFLVQEEIMGSHDLDINKHHINEKNTKICKSIMILYSTVILENNVLITTT